MHYVQAQPGQNDKAQPALNQTRQRTNQPSLVDKEDSKQNHLSARAFRSGGAQL